MLTHKKTKKQKRLIKILLCVLQSTGDTEIPELSVCLPRGHGLIGKADVK